MFVYAPYTAEIALSAKAVSNLPLDPIQCAGVIQAVHQRKLAAFAPFSHAAYRTINDLPYFLSLLKDDETRSLADKPVPKEVWPKTKAVWKAHIRDLKGARIVEVGAAPHLMVCKYFAVAKANGETARSIFSGGSLSALFVRPPSVNLPHLPLVLYLMAAIVGSTSSAIFLLCSDLRHYFHEIAVASDLHRFFTICIAGVLYYFLTLVMGWSFSPRIAQCYAWSALLLQADEKNGLMKAAGECGQLHHPPAFVYLHDADGMRVGLTFIWYDNFVSITSNKDIAVHLSQTMTRMSAQYGMVWGEKQMTHHSQLVALGKTSMMDITAEKDEKRGDFMKKTAVAIGVQFALLAKRSRDGNQCSLRWRLKPKTCMKARDLLNGLPPTHGKVTCRHVAAICGCAVWRAYIAMEPMTKIHSVIALSSRAGTIARVSTWSASMHVTDEDLEVMRGALSHIVENEWIDPCIVPIHSTTIVCSDASLQRGAWTLISDAGTRVDWDSWTWPLDQRNEIIFVLELRAAVRAIKCHARKGGLLILLCDNTAVVAVLRRFYSSTNIGRSLAEEAWSHLQSVQCKLLVVGIGTLDNDADSPTRGDIDEPAFTDHRLKQSFETASRALYGQDRKTINPNIMIGSHHDSPYAPDPSEVDLDAECSIDGLCDLVMDTVQKLTVETSLETM